MLVEVARILRNQSLDHNFARLGGEEFAVVAQVADLATARELARSIVDAVNSSQLYGLSMSISVGLANRDPGESMFSLMRRADLALYDAINAGKNCYAVAEQAELSV